MSDGPVDLGEVVDRRAAFRERCLALARARDPALEARVAALFHPGVAAEGASGGTGTAPAHVVPVPARLLIVPGLLGDSVRALVIPFAGARERLVPEGRDIRVAWVNGRAGCTRNGARLRAVVLEQAAATGAPIDLVGYSKGCPDALHMLADWPDTHAALRSLTSLGGVVGGTPLARDAPSLASRALRHLPLPTPFAGFGPGDGRALIDMTPETCRRWLAEHRLPGGIRYASIVASPSPERVSRILKGSWRALARVDPANDSQVIADDAVLPRGELLATVNADHWALALPIAERGFVLGHLFVDHNDFPRTLMIEALMDHLAVPPATVGRPAAIGEAM